MADNQNQNQNQNPPPPIQQHHKKQVRRRLHTTRPYQERLLNMAEARREIVTALKYHRAAMKRAASASGDPHQRQLETFPEPPPPPPPHPARCQEGRIRGTKITKSSTTDRNRNRNLNLNCNNNNDNSLKNLKNMCYDHPAFPNWSMNSESVDIVLPEQTLGLNLNLKDFNNLDASLFTNGGSVSGSCSSSSPSLSIATDQEGGLNSASESNTGGGGGMHVAVGEEEIAEMRSIGEKHEMEWSDKMSMVKSAWWLRFMKIGKLKEEQDEEDEEFRFGDPFPQILEFPDWMNNGNETDFQQQFFNDYCSLDDPHPPALPCMDIGEFEGMDGEWLA